MHINKYITLGLYIFTMIPKVDHLDQLFTDKVLLMSLQKSS